MNDTIQVNGESQPLSSGSVTIEQYLATAAIVRQHIAVALNGQLVHSSDFAATTLQAGDRLEIVTPAAGG